MVKYINNTTAQAMINGFKSKFGNNSALKTMSKNFVGAINELKLAIANLPQPQQDIPMILSQVTLPSDIVDLYNSDENNRMGIAGTSFICETNNVLFVSCKVYGRGYSDLDSAIIYTTDGKNYHRLLSAQAVIRDAVFAGNRYIIKYEDISSGNQKICIFSNTFELIDTFDSDNISRFYYDGNIVVEKSFNGKYFIDGDNTEHQCIFKNYNGNIISTNWSDWFSPDIIKINDNNYIMVPNDSNGDGAGKNRRAYHSTDLITWTGSTVGQNGISSNGLESSDRTAYFTGINTNGNKFAICELQHSNNSTEQIYYTTDGLTWSKVLTFKGKTATSRNDAVCKNVLSNGTTAFYISNGNNTLISFDGINWSTYSVNSEASYGFIADIMPDGSILERCNFNNNTYYEFYKSSDLGATRTLFGPQVSTEDFGENETYLDFNLIKHNNLYFMEVCSKPSYIYKTYYSNDEGQTWHLLDFSSIVNSMKIHIIYNLIFNYKNMILMTIRDDASSGSSTNDKTKYIVYSTDNGITYSLYSIYDDSVPVYTNSNWMYGINNSICFIEGNDLRCMN